MTLVINNNVEKKVIHATNVCSHQCYLLPLEESNVEDGCVEVQKLEDEHFKDETVFKFRNSSMTLWQNMTQIIHTNRQTTMNLLIYLPTYFQYQWI